MSAENPQEDIDKLTKALKAEREGRKVESAAHKTALAELTAKLAEAQTLQAPDAEHMAAHISEAVKAQVAMTTVDLTGKLAAAEASHVAVTTELAATKETLASTRLEMKVTAALTKDHVRPECHADLLQFAKLDGLTLDDQGEVVGKDGADLDSWIWGQRSSHPWAWPTSKGTGARGNKGAPPEGNNPWMTGTSFNLTRQAELLHIAPARAATMMAEAAGQKL